MTAIPWDDDEPTNHEDRAWWTTWPNGAQLVWARTIQDARLAARAHAGPTAPVRARLATRAEQGLEA